MRFTDGSAITRDIKIVSKFNREIQVINKKLDEIEFRIENLEEQGGKE